MDKKFAVVEGAVIVFETIENHAPSCRIRPETSESVYEGRTDDLPTEVFESLCERSRLAR